ncbi:MAG TPA: serine hydrolase domain-containing protein [Pyrinomonadaceae bacterium]|jgi:CubicO group peptidase (beta-lactamase class C family)
MKLSHRRGMLPLKVVLLLACLLAPVSVLAQAEQAKFDELRKVLREELKKTNTPGAALAIVSGDRVIFAEGFGVANVETGAPVTPDMLFRLGSTTKMFTGAALVTLAANGKLKLDAPIGASASGLNQKLARLTAHQLISNTAGMADIQAPFVSQDDGALAKMVRAWKDDALFTEPGEIYSYSSAGFWLAGYVVEEVSKKPYAEAMAELLFEPLGMKRTTLRPSVAMTYPLAMGHSVFGRASPAVIRPFFNNVAMWPAGSIFSSVNELSRFVIALMNDGRLDGKQILSPSISSKLMGKYTTMPGAPEVSYGYGLLGFEERGVRMFAHGGFSRGYGSMIQMAPEQRFSIIVQTNKSGETLPQTRARAMELFLTLKPAAAEEKKTVLALSATEAADFAGQYRNGTQTWEIINKDGKLFVKQEGNELPLTRSGKYRLSYGDALENDFVFVPDAAGRVKYLFDGLYSAKKI